MAYDSVDQKGNKVSAALMDRFKREMIEASISGGPVFKTYDEWYLNTIAPKSANADTKK